MTLPETASDAGKPIALDVPIQSIGENKMSDLIERLERLTGPCRECDALIFRLLANAPAENHWYEYRGEWLSDDTVSKVTNSIDAAMTLVPDGFRICNFSQHDHKILRERGEWMCSLYPDGKIDEMNRMFDWPRCENAPTPAIALCIAALKATP